jgi:cell division protein FtsB
VPLNRALAALAVLGMGYFALQGGDYGTGDLLALRRQAREERARISRLRHDVDSLARYDRALKTDPATQERVARELFGMIRPGEILYQVVPRDSGGGGRQAADPRRR